MSGTVRALVAVTLIFLAAIILSRRLPAPAANGQARRCEIPAESARALHLDRFADRAHLRAEAATAESWAIAYADVSPQRQQGAGPYAQVREQCTATLFVRISQRHAIDVGTVREYARQRDIVFDIAVLLLFAFAYVVIAYQLVGGIMQRISADERFALASAVIIVSAMTVFVAVLAGDSWSIGAEVLRVGNGHLGDRTERLPWRQYRPAITATALGVFWLVAAVRVRRERVQSTERRAVLGSCTQIGDSQNDIPRS
jgi:hypothetical protein